MAAQLGGRVEPGAVHEFGYAEVRARGHSALLRDIEDRVNADGHGLLDVWMSHGDHVVELPKGFRTIASTADVPNAGMADEARRFYALQFHPEVTHTRQGTRIYERFLHGICGCDSGWNAGNIIEDAVARVRAQVGGGKVLLGLSGGVDSSVVAALLHKAIGDQLTCVFVDHGLLRHHEGDQVMAVFARNLGVRVIRVDAAERFFTALAGVSDPEAKRKIIGRLFIEVFDEEANKLQGVDFLAQGTIYPDVIESADEGRDIGGPGLGGEQSLQRGEDQRQVGLKALLTENLGRFESFCGQRQLDDDLVRSKARELLPFLDHAGSLGCHYFCGNRPVDQADDLLEDLVKIPAAFGDQRGVGGDAVNQPQFAGGSDFSDVSGIDEKFHVSAP